MNNEAIVDLSHPLSTETPPFPGDGPVTIEVMDAIRGGSKRWSTPLQFEPAEHEHALRHTHGCAVSFFQ